MNGLTLPMLRLLSSKAQERKDFYKLSKPCHVGTHALESSRGVLSDEYLLARVSIIFQDFCIILYWPK